MYYCQKTNIMGNEMERVPKQILCNPSSGSTSAIVLFGGSSCGKSSTLQHLIVLLCGGGTLKKSVQAAFERAFYYSKHDCYKDVDVVVYYHTEKGEIPIYISTDGDTWPIVEDNFRFFYHCIRTRHKVYEYKGGQFIQHDYDSLKSLKRPEICITAANFIQFGGTQAAHYYLDLTCEDWKYNIWIRKYPCSNPGQPIPGYVKPRKKRIKEEDDKQAKRLLCIIDKMIKNNICINRIANNNLL